MNRILNTISKVNQYTDDIETLSSLIFHFTGVEKTQIDTFIKEHSPGYILSSANALCKTPAQRRKLSALFEFNRLYKTLRQAEDKNVYQLTSSSDTIKYFSAYFADMNDRERFVVAYLNSKNRIIATTVMFEGTINEAPIYMREIIKEALFLGAVNVILAHNHPGGSAAASRADIESSLKLKEALQTVNCRVIDHIIVAGSDTISLAESGAIKF